MPTKKHSANREPYIAILLLADFLSVEKYNLLINYPCNSIYFSGSEDRRHHCEHTFLSSQWVPFLERSI